MGNIKNRTDYDRNKLINSIEPSKIAVYSANSSDKTISDSQIVYVVGTGDVTNLYIAPEGESIAIPDIDFEGIIPIVHNIKNDINKPDDADTQALSKYTRIMNEHPKHHTISAKLFKDTIDALPKVCDDIETEKTEKYFDTNSNEVTRQKVPSLKLHYDLDSVVIKHEHVINNFNGTPAGKSDNEYVLSAALGPEIKRLIDNAGSPLIVIDDASKGTPNPYLDENGNPDLTKTDNDFIISAKAAKDFYDKVFSEKSKDNTSIENMSILERIKSLETKILSIGVQSDLEQRVATLEQLNLENRVRNLEQIEFIDGGKIL